ncbi:MAG: SMC-Scp complex subunit ScpB [Peptococcaceae bacterium]|nr:SMC-Scp complex subunit ScpB [Peptococcaceae bacterium]
MEALLFVSGEPLSVKALVSLTQIPEDEVLAQLKDLKADYERERRGFTLEELAGGFLFATRPEHSVYIERLVRPRLNTLTQAALETLSIIAYRQPVTRPEIDDIRGVNSDSSVGTLLERGLIEEKGRKETPGRPMIYGTTQDFLKYFGFKSLRELPPAEAPGAAREAGDGEAAGEAGDAAGETPAWEEAWGAGAGADADGAGNGEDVAGEAGAGEAPAQEDTETGDGADARENAETGVEADARGNVDASAQDEAVAGDAGAQEDTARGTLAEEAAARGAVAQGDAARGDAREETGGEAKTVTGEETGNGADARDAGAPEPEPPRPVE